MQWFCVANKEQSSEHHEDGFNLHSATDSNPRRIWAWSAEISSDETDTCKNNHNGTFSHEHLKTAPFLSSRWLQMDCCSCTVHVPAITAYVNSSRHLQIFQTVIGVKIQHVSNWLWNKSKLNRQYVVEKQTDLIRIEIKKQLFFPYT